MIFVTTGTQHPYDRLVLAVDQWAGHSGRTDVFAQIGSDGHEPSHINWNRMLSAAETSRRIAESDLVVAHAGIGTIITALTMGKPIIIMPRRADLNETRGAHQMATAHHLRNQPGVIVAENETALPAALDRALAADSPTPALAPHASEPLLCAIREFIGQGS